MKNKKFLKLVGSACLVLVLVALSVASCTEVTPTPTPTPGPGPTPGTGPISPTPPPAGVQSGGTLRLSSPSAVFSLGTPLVMTRADDFTKVHPCIETLITYDETGIPVPWLATSWEADPEAKTYTIHLREGVKFHDGSDFNAEVLKWNFERYMATGRAELKTIETIDVIDDYTAQLNLSSYDSLMITNLGIYPGMMISKEACEAHGQEWAEKNPVGTGPFKFVSWEKDVSIRFERFDDYWQEGKPYLDAIEWHIIGDPLVQLASFLKGEEDIIATLNPKDAYDLEATGKYRVNALSTGFHFWVNDGANAFSVFSDIRVRRAVEHAVDKQTICDALGYGYWRPVYQFARPGGWAENPDVVGHHYDPDKARELLVEAGYPDGFKTTLYTSTASAYYKDYMTAVQNYLEEIGVDATIELCERGREQQIAVRGGWENGTFSQGVGLYAPDELMSLNRFFARGTVLFVSKYTAPEFQDVLEEAVAAPDFETKAALTRELQYLMIDKYAMVPWLNATTSVAAKYLEVHDDGLYQCASTLHWTPEDAWIEH